MIVTVMIACTKTESPLPYYNSVELTPTWISNESHHTVSDFSFTDQDGNQVSSKEFEGKVYVASFFFTICPSICPKLTTNMKMVADQFKDDARVKFISHSVTPGIDSVARLKKYSDKYQIDSRQWHLVTGDKKEIYDLARNSYFAEQEQGFNAKNDFLHTEHFMLIDAQGHVRGIYKGTLVPEVMRLKEDIDVLLAGE